MKKQKYTIYLSNTSKIVLTGNYMEKQKIVKKIYNLLKSKQYALFDTGTDLVFVNPIKIISIHISNLESEAEVEDEVINNEQYISEIEREDGIEEDFSDDSFDESNIDMAINDAFEKMDLSDLNEFSNGENLYQEAETILTNDSSIQETNIKIDEDDEREEVLLDCSSGK